MFDNLDHFKDSRQKENSGLKKQIYNYLQKLYKDYPRNEKPYRIDKNHGSIFQRNGRPDLQIIYKAKTIYIELKDAKGSLSTEQVALIKEFARLGVTVHVIESLQEFKDLWSTLK